MENSSLTEETTEIETLSVSPTTQGKLCCDVVNMLIVPYCQIKKK